MLFKDISGQEAIKIKLKQTVKDQRISHAQLFAGPEGSGKIALAIAYAQFINCVNRPDLATIDISEADSCGTCPSCIKYQQISHPDLHFIFPVATTRVITKKPMSRDFIRQWRELLLNNDFFFDLNDWNNAIGIEKKQSIINADDCSEILRTLSYKSYESEYKVMIIWSAERLFYSAAPKLLKIIEEPPEKTLFILITEQQDKILNTILSRSQIVKIRPMLESDILEALVNRKGLDEKEAGKIASMANGNYLMALKQIEGHQEFQDMLDEFIKWMRMVYAGKIYELNEFVGIRNSHGREKNKAFLNYSAHMIRQGFLIHNQLGEKIRISKSELEFLKKFSPFINNENIQEIAVQLEKAQYHIERNANPQFTFMDLSLKINRLLKSGAKRT